LIAAASALLVILPVLAADGQINKGTQPRFNVAVFDDVAAIEAPDSLDGTTAGSVDSGDLLWLTDAGFDPEDTRVGVTLYVSNDTAAFNTVLVSFLDTTLSASSETADVENITSGDELTLVLFQTADAGDEERQAIFTVTEDGPTAGTVLMADHGDVIEVTGPSGTKTTLIVDGDGPDVASVSPEHEATQTGTAIEFAAAVTDADSGLRNDDEPTPTLTGSADGDSDGITTGEPLAGTGGGSTDILINIGTNILGVGGTELSSEATDGWIAITDGFSFSFERSGFAVDETYWEIVATDRVGNVTTTDSDDDDDDVDAFEVNIDNQDPVFDAAITGTGWDPSDGDDGAEEGNDAAIKITFENETSGDADDIDEDTVDITDFIMSDDIEIDEVFVNDNAVYLILTEDLGADDEPDIQMLAGVIKDVSGNSNGTLSTDVDDKIAPTFTVTITGDASSRAVAEEELTVRVESNEPLVSAPTIYFVDFEATPTDDDIVIAGVANDEMKAVSGSDTAWEETYEDSDMGVPASGLIGFIVLGTDENGNDGVTEGGATAGTAPVAGDDLDIEDMNEDGLLAELDAAAPTVSVTLLPGANDETESSSPFIRLTFTESGEYKIGISDETKVDQDGDGEDKVDTDAHDNVTITAITLDDVDITDSVARIDDETFNVATANLSLGDHELAYTAADDVGNEEEFEYEFEVVERSEYEVSLSPGWNLISLPGTPNDADLDSVLPDSMKADRILSWVDGAFEVSERESDGTWDASGGVTELVAGRGYWIYTTAFEDIEALIPLPDPANILPTVAVVGGWNLLGVIDLDQADAGDSVGAPDTYLASIEFSVVYSYDTQGNSWTRLVNASTNMETGAGYWVWVTEAGTLVP
jgi:hypothetical protein